MAAQLRLARRRLEASLEAGIEGRELGAVFGELGQLYHAYELGEAAAACYERAIGLAGDDARWSYLSALLLEETGQLETAAGRLARVLELEPTATAARIRLGDALSRLGRHEEAAATLEAALPSGDPAALAALGEVELARGHHVGAIELLETALALAPGATRLYYPLAQALRASGDEDRARSELARAGRAGLRPIDPLYDRVQSLRVGETAHTLRGRRAFAAGQLEDARREFELALAAAPASTGARVNLATVLSAAGERDEAIEHLRVAIELDAENQIAHHNLGRLLASLGRNAEARFSLERALELEPGDAETRLALASVLRSVGEGTAALEQLAVLRRLAPRHELGWLAAAQYLVEDGAIAQALELLERGYGELPGSPGLANGLARLLAAGPDPALRDGQRAVDLAGQAFRANELPLHAETMSLALAESGRCADAAEWTREALSRLAPGQGSLAERLARRRAELERAVAELTPCRP
ncbi:MAG TPA: tetratricopeptide repeat protein [Thermoanaerobaculia bacterium]|nr:tetratricopeptide repeat protein [Thermoanaerobaculia bacterium]